MVLADIQDSGINRRRWGKGLVFLFVVFHLEALAVAASAVLEVCIDTGCMAMAGLTKNEFFLWSVWQ